MSPHDKTKNRQRQLPLKPFLRFFIFCCCPLRYGMSPWSAPLRIKCLPRRSPQLRHVFILQTTDLNISFFSQIGASPKRYLHQSKEVLWTSWFTASALIARLFAVAVTASCNNGEPFARISTALCPRRRNGESAWNARTNWKEENSRRGKCYDQSATTSCAGKRHAAPWVASKTVKPDIVPLASTR